MGFQSIGQTLRGVRAPNGATLLRQSYTDDGIDPLPDGVIIVPQRVWPDDGGGSFKEVVRLSPEGRVQAAALLERGVSLAPAQLNVSVVAPGTRRFWHVHPTQSELWTVAYGQLNAGLVDCREGSPTFGKQAKVVLTPDKGVYIPAGVAHGYVNTSSAVAVLHYLPDRQFTRGEQTEEWRISPDELPYDFVLADIL